jgi:hypothetical protein
MAGHCVPRFCQIHQPDPAPRASIGPDLNRKQGFNSRF